MGLAGMLKLLMVSLDRVAVREITNVLREQFEVVALADIAAARGVLARAVVHAVIVEHLPPKDDVLEFFPISTAVNKVSNDTAEIQMPAGPVERPERAPKREPAPVVQPDLFN